MAAMASQAGDSSGLTAHEGDDGQGQEHGSSKPEETLHIFKPPDGRKRIASRTQPQCSEAVTKPDRPGTATGSQNTDRDSPPRHNKLFRLRSFIFLRGMGVVQ
jgi:hypothetical protein